MSKKLNDPTIPTTAPQANDRLPIGRIGGDTALTTTPAFLLAWIAENLIDRTITAPAQLPETAQANEMKWFINAERDALTCYEYRADAKWHLIL